MVGHIIRISLFQVECMTFIVLFHSQKHTYKMRRRTLVSHTAYGIICTLNMSAIYSKLFNGKVRIGHNEIINFWNATLFFLSTIYLFFPLYFHRKCKCSSVQSIIILKYLIMMLNKSPGQWINGIKINNEMNEKFWLLLKLSMRKIFSLLHHGKVII